MKKHQRAFLFATGLLASTVLHAQTSIQPGVPPLPPSPVEQFRLWLRLPAESHEKALEGYAPEKQSVLRAKLKEYAALPEHERERRLKMVELRHYLYPLMQISPAARSNHLENIPASMKPLVSDRLAQWDALDLAIQKSVLDSEWASRYFVRFQNDPPRPNGQKMVSFKGPGMNETEDKLAQWKLLPQEERLRRYRQFNAFFELPLQKKEKALEVLGEKERVEMEKTLKMFSNLSPQQRAVCIHSFRKFANMTPEERSLFLKNAERWRSLPSEDREAWSKLVQSVPPLPSELPPLPFDGLDQPPMPSVHKK